MFEFHTDKKKYFDFNIANVEKYILPFIEEKFVIRQNMRVLEIGCGEGGVLKAFINRGCTGVGVELDNARLELAREWMNEEISQNKVVFISRNIYDMTIAELGGHFDIIILKDVIEHIHDQPKLMEYMKGLLVEKGVIFFGFPPWQMPLGGHQQILKNKVLSKIPWYHLLPRPLYAGILKAAGENVADMMEIRDTGISIERFEKIVKASKYTILNHRHYLINPIYEYKFGLKPVKQASLIKAVPWVRNFFTTCAYYLIQKN
jgi:SAM-dependent methyltransferase